MNYSNTILKLLLSFVGTIIYMLFSYRGEGDILLGISIFIISFVVLSLWMWFMENILSRSRITKDTDEINHPVIQVENTLHIVNIQKHYGKDFNPRLVETCKCGSTMFRIYNEDTLKGTYIQFICIKCNQKATGHEFNWKQKV